MNSYTHKSDGGGVTLDLENADAVGGAAEAILERARLEGFTVQVMARRKPLIKWRTHFIQAQAQPRSRLTRVARTLAHRNRDRSTFNNRPVWVHFGLILISNF